MRETVLLVEPEWPIPANSKNHFKWLPLALLKISTFEKLRGNRVVLTRGLNMFTSPVPDRIMG